VRDRNKIILVTVVGVVALVAVVVFPYLVRGCHNEALANNLHAEFDAWLASLPKIPDSENGALVILEGLVLLEDLPVEYSLMKGYHLTKDGETAAVIRGYLSRNAKALQTVEKGLEYAKWLYPTDYSKGYEALLPHVYNGMKGARAFSLKGDLARLDGDGSAALNEYKKTLRFGGTYSSDRMIVSRLVEIAIYKLALEGIMTLLSEGAAAEEGLSDLCSFIAERHGARGDFHSAMEGERCTFSGTVANVIDGKGRAEVLLDLPPMYGLWKYYNWQSEVDTCRRFHEIRRTAEPAQYHAAPESMKDSGVMTETLGHIPVRTRKRAILTATVFVMTFGRFAEDETFWRAVIIMTAVRLFDAKNGRLPENLEELSELVPEEMLIDPFSGKHLVYRLKGDDFCLYSVGVDGIDGKCEDTRELFDAKQREDEPDDIIFHAPRQSGK
jgi:hypothetical protein